MRGDKIKGAGGAGAASEGPLVLPDSVPTIDDDVLAGATRRSARARRLHARLEARAEEGRPLGAREVDGLVRDCQSKDGKPDGDQAVVLAAHARRNPQMFGGGHGGLLRLLARIAWRALVGDLRAFIAQVREREAQERHREELRLSLEQDRIEQETKKLELGRDDLKKAALRAPDLKDVDAKLDEESRLRHTLERMKRPVR